jgi:hypothetical protein
MHRKETAITNMGSNKFDICHRYTPGEANTSEERKKYN